VLHGLLSIHADSRMAAMQSCGVGAEPSAIDHPDELSRLHGIPLRLSLSSDVADAQLGWRAS